MNLTIKNGALTSKMMDIPQVKEIGLARKWMWPTEIGQVRHFLAWQDAVLTAS